MLFPAAEFCGQSSAGLYVTIIDSQSKEISSGVIRLINRQNLIIAQEVFNYAHSIGFENLKSDEVKVEIESPGFEPFQKKIKLTKGNNSITVKLEIKEIKVDVEIKQSDLESRLNQTFNGILSKEEIDSLPNDPREIEKELKRRYGDDLIIRINGFTGGVIPPKADIQSIQITRSGFDAEYHELGRPSVNITTKASTRKIVGMILFNYGNSTLNARNAFALTKLPAQTDSILGFVSGPLVKGKSSFKISFDRLWKAEQQDIITNFQSASEPENAIEFFGNRNFSAGIDYNLNSNFTLRLEYVNSLNQILNAGVGGLTTLERGFNSERKNNEIKVSVNGTFAERYTNQFRSRLSFKQNNINSNSQTVGITVAGAVNTGGAGLKSDSNTDQAEFFEMLSFGTASQFIKLGGEFHFERAKYLSANGINGNFYFSSPENYLLRKPSLYYRQTGLTDLTFYRDDFAFFAQDDFQISKRLRVGLGLRYENQNHISDTNNLSPRLSVTMAADGKGRIIVRAGAGLLSQWYESDDLQRILTNDGRQSKELIIKNPEFPNADSGQISPESLVPNIYKQASNLQNPQIFITQTAVNFNLGSGLKFDASYKYERGIHQFRSRDINAAIQDVRPDVNFGRIIYLESSGISTGNSLEISGEGVLFKKLRINGRYRLSKSTDDYGDTFSLPVNNYNLRLEKARSNQDQRQFFTSDFEYSPFKDFNLNPSFIIASPTPYTFTTGLDNNNDTVFNDRPDRINRNSAQGSWTRTVNLAASWSVPFLKRTLKVNTNGEKTTGNLPDFLKYYKIDFSVNVTNLFNTTRKQGYIGNQLSPFFGQAALSNPARSITFGIMFLYF